MRLSRSDHCAYFLEAVLKHMKHEGHGYQKRFMKFMELLMILKNKRPSDPYHPALQGIRHMLSPYPYLIQEFNAFLPHCCKLKPLCQDHSKIKVLDDGFDFVQMVKDRLSENEFRRFACLLSEWNSGENSNSGTIADIEDLLSQHTDLIEKFENFKPLPPKQVSERRRRRKGVVPQENVNFMVLGGIDVCSKIEDCLFELDILVERYRTLVRQISRFLEVMQNNATSSVICIKDYLTPLSLTCLKALYAERFKDDIVKLLKENGVDVLNYVRQQLKKQEKQRSLFTEKIHKFWAKENSIKEGSSKTERPIHQASTVCVYQQPSCQLIFKSPVRTFREW